MEIRFVATNADGSSQKRRLIHRACETCRKRKKRCEHVENDAEVGDARTSAGSGSPLSMVQQFTSANPLVSGGYQAHEKIVESEGQDDSRSQSTSNEDPSRPPADSLSNVESPSRSRFVGDLSPEAVFLSQGGPRSKRHVSDRDRIGIWLANKDEKTSKSPDAIPIHDSVRDRNSNLLPPALQAFRPYLEKECLATMPPTISINGLVDIYSLKIHPIVPIVDLVRFNTAQEQGAAHTLLKQAVCLVASKDISAAEYLSFDGDSSLLSHREFAGKLSTSLKISLNMGMLERNKVVQTQILALLFLHSDGPDGWEESSMHLAGAIHNAQTLGLHLGRASNNENDEYLERLFCCLWGLDKLNAGLNGRPIMIHDRDVSIDLHAAFQKQTPEFAIFLQVATILNRVIELYRPSVDPSVTGWEDDFPGFEELVIQCNGHNLTPSLLATVEVFYHAVAILSCRSRSFRETPRSTPSYVRQSLSAMRIRSIVGIEFHQQLSLLPFIPYGLSLSMSVAYQQLRQSRLAMHRKRARTDFETSCTLLKELGMLFWSAEAVARLGQRTLQEVDKGTSKAENRHRKRSRNHSHPGQTGLPIESPLNRAEEHNTQKLRRIDILERSSDTQAEQARLVSAHETDSQFQTNSNNSLFSPVPTSSVAETSEMDVFSQWDATLNFEDMDAIFGGQLDLSFPTHFDELLIMGGPIPEPPPEIN